MRNTKRFMGLFMAAMMILSCISGMIFVSAEGETSEIKPVFIYEGWLLDCKGGSNCEAAAYDYTKGYITLTATAEDPFYSLTAGMVAAPYMLVKYRSTATDGALAEMHIGNGGAANGLTDKVVWGLAAGDWQHAILNIGELGDYNVATNVLNHVRFDFFANYEAGATLDVEYIAFFNTEADAQAYADGNMHKLPAEPQEFTITFLKEDGSVLRSLTYKEGAPSVSEPAVPKKEGMVGKWESYTLNGDVTVKPVYTEYNPHKFDSFTHLDQFGEEHSDYIKFTQCVPTFNEDGTITYTGTWGIDADVEAKITIDYYRLMQNFNGTGESFKKTKLANANGDGNVVVFKVKGSTVMAEEGSVQLFMTAGLGKDLMECYVDPISVISGDGSEEYLIFDLTDEDGYANLFINKLELIWAFTYGTEDNIKNTCTLVGIDMYASLDDALAATGETLPETEEETTAEETTAEETTAAETEAKTEAKTEAPKSEGGCRSVVATGAVVAVMVAAAAAVALKKKD